MIFVQIFVLLMIRDFKNKQGLFFSNSKSTVFFRDPELVDPF